MRDRLLRRRLPGVVGAAVATVVLVGAPAALAQLDSDWEGSSFDAPLDDDADTTVTSESFPISGVFGPNSGITGVEVDFGRMTDGVYDSADGDVCVPDDVGYVPDTATTENADEADADPATYEFDVATVEDDEITWPCNGRFLVRATATALVTPDPDDPDPDPEDQHTLAAVVVVAVPPPPVTRVETTVDEDADEVTVTWVPLDDDQLADDALGYRVERSGPGADDAFTPVGERIGLHDEPTLVNHVNEAGTYRYQVRALRRGADGPIPSAAVPEGVASATVASVPVPSTTAGAPTFPGLGSGRLRPGSSAATRSGPPTTIDTGYQNELDYGDRPTVGTSSTELADGGGQSIIRTEGGGVGLVAPAAGALVLAGWAGHLVYLNRLSKQF